MSDAVSSEEGEEKPWKKFTDLECPLCDGQGVVMSRQPQDCGWRWCDCAIANRHAHQRANPMPPVVAGWVEVRAVADIAQKEREHLEYGCAEAFVYLQWLERQRADMSLTQVEWLRAHERYMAARNVSPPTDEELVAQVRDCVDFEPEHMAAALTAFNEIVRRLTHGGAADGSS